MRWEEVTKAGAVVCGAIAGFYGGWSEALTLLCILMIMDYVTGIVCAARGRSLKTESGGLSSKVGFDGLLRKVFMLVLVAVAHVVDKVTGANIFQTAITLFFIANEGISIAENAKLMGVDIPKGFMNALEVMRDKNDHTDSADDTKDDASGKEE